MNAQAALLAAGIHADNTGIHLLPPDKMNNASELQKDTKEFLLKTKQFGEIMQDYVALMDSRAKVLENEKLKAIGLTNRVDSEADNRNRKQAELNSMVNEKKAELERLNAFIESLMRVDADQKAMIERLTNNEV